MHLMELLTEDLVNIDMEARTKYDAIEELVDLLIGQHEIKLRDRAPVLTAIFSREEQLSTGMEYGIAIPHGIVEVLDEVVAALGICREGIDFDCVDGRPAQLILLMAIPRNAFKSHVRTLASVARLFHHAEMREALIGAATTAEVIHIIHDVETREFESL